MALANQTKGNIMFWYSIGFNYVYGFATEATGFKSYSEAQKALETGDFHPKAYVAKVTI